ncbi:hypothetical protein WN48_03624, partial [Eufriesea mexicana]
TTNSSLASATRIINHHLFGSGIGPRHYTEEKHAQDEAMTENKNKEERKKSRAKIEEPLKDSQTMLICSLRAPKAKKLSIEEKRKAKTSSHSCKGTDTNCLPQEHRFSS